VNINLSRFRPLIQL